MDECTAALVLMSLSASPRSPTFLTERLSLFKCTWPGCVHETFKCSEIEKHVREEHLNKFERGTGEEEFYYTEVDLRHKDGSQQPFSSASMTTHSSGPDSPVSLSEDAASTSSSTSAVMTGDNSMDSNPPSPENSNFFKSNTSAFVPVHQYRHLEDHEYNRRPDPAGISILGSAARRGRKGTNSSSVLSPGASSSHPINTPSMDSDSQPMMSSSFGGFSGASSLSSGFGSYNSFGSSFTPLSPPRSSGSLSSSLSSGSNKYLRIGAGRGSSGTTLLQNGGVNRTSPTKRVRGETRKCRKVYGMEKKEAWCTQCKWKKACTRFLD